MCRGSVGIIFKLSDFHGLGAAAIVLYEKNYGLKIELHSLRFNITRSKILRLSSPSFSTRVQLSELSDKRVMHSSGFAAGY